MSDTTQTPDPADEKREQATAVLPVLASLDQQATALDRASDKGEQITQNSVVSYELAAHHAKHLISSGGISADDIKTAAAELGGTTARSSAERALDHASHTRSYQPAPSHQTEQDKDVEEEIDL